MALSRFERAALLRNDFYAFMQSCFHELHAQTPFLDNWHLELLAAKLEACRRGQCRRLIINVPPRSLKSLAASIAFPAWLLGHQPSAQIICASYAQDLADTHARHCRRVMASAAYRALFATRLSPQRQSVAEFMTTALGFRLATSVGGVLTGRGADYLIIDDPLKPNEALSQSQRVGVNDWYDHTLYSRLNSKESGCIILIMQRLHLDDLVGHVLAQEDWELLSLPAIAEVEETHRIWTPYGPYTHTRHLGEALHPQRESLDTLQRIRATMGEYHFAGQYQQQPLPLGGGLVKRAWFKEYAAHERPQCFERVVQSWDTANTASELADFSVCTTWGLQGNHIYLLDELRQRLDYPNLKRAVRAQYQQFHPDVVLIENHGSGSALIQDFKHEGLYAVLGIKPEGDKVMRLHAQSATIENGFVYVPKQAPWLAEYLLELTTFPKGKHDDQVDSTSQALEWIKSGMWANGMGVFMWYKEQAEKLARRA